MSTKRRTDDVLSVSEPLLLSRVNAAAFITISVATLDRMQAAGLLPRTLVINRGVRYRREDLDRWIALGCPDRKSFEAIEDV